MVRLLFILAFLLEGSNVFCSVLEVGSSKGYSTVTGAVNAAVECDTILVHPGRYKEGKLVIDKSLCLLGVGYPVLDGEGKHQVLSLGGPYITIHGFELINTGYSSLDDMAAIKVYTGQYIEITGNRIRNAFFGIYLLNSTDCFIRDNEITGQIETSSDAGNGIHLWKSSRVLISGNKVTGHRDGIYFEFVTNSEISGNTSNHNERYGLHFMFSHDDYYHHNIFKENGAGVAVMYSHGVNMYSNLFIRNSSGASYGLLLKEISDSKINENQFEFNSTAMMMEGTSRIEVTHNAFSENGWAVRIQASCMDIIFHRNNFTSNSFDVATNGSLMLNNFDGNYWDKYEGYDLNRDGTGDVPHRPVDLYSMVIEKIPVSVVLYGSMTVAILDRTEKVIPGITPEALEDKLPGMHAYD